MDETQKLLTKALLCAFSKPTLVSPNEYIMELAGVTVVARKLRLNRTFNMTAMSDPMQFRKDNMRLWSYKPPYSDRELFS